MIPKISVIIVNYNTGAFLGPCLDSIKAQTVKEAFEVLIFDNNSTDGSQKIISKSYPGVRLIKSEKNLGFAEANNRANRVASGKYLFFLNPDTKLHERCFSDLLLSAEKMLDEDFILTPTQFSYEGCFFLSLGLAADIFGYPNNAYSDHGRKQIRPIFYAEGATIFLPKRTFEKLGEFDSGMFMFQEDIDLSWKAHLMGIRICPVPEATVYHKVGVVGGGGIIKKGAYETSLFRRYHSEKNLLRVLLKNYSLSYLVWVLPLNVIINFFEAVTFLVLLKPRVSLIYAKAYYWNFKNLKSTLDKRKFIQSKRTVSDREILKKMVKIPSKLFLLVRAGIPKLR